MAVKQHMVYKLFEGMVYIFPPTKALRAMAAQVRGHYGAGLAE